MYVYIYVQYMNHTNILCINLSIFLYSSSIDFSVQLVNRAFVVNRLLAL